LTVNRREQDEVDVMSRKVNVGDMVQCGKIKCSLLLDKTAA